jgi:hypothetical protein
MGMKTKSLINNMKKFYLVLGLSLLILGTAVAKSQVNPKGKHKSHKKSKKKVEVSVQLPALI